jgi:hypothetical protein
MDSATMVCMEKLQKEIDFLKDNCLLMDEDFETIKCNRNVPGMSDLMKVSDHLEISKQEVVHDSNTTKEDTARACFEGLYSLTNIKNSISSELSDSLSAQHRQNSMVDSAESLEWDSPKVTSPAKAALNDTLSQVTEGVAMTPVSSVLDSSGRSRSETLGISEEELMANLEWDCEDLTEYPDLSGYSLADTEPNLIAGMDTLEMDLETELASRDNETPCNTSEAADKSHDSTTSTRSCTASPVTER